MCQSNPSRHLLIQSQQRKHQNNVWNLFNVNNKDIRTTSLTSFWCLYWYLEEISHNCSGVFIVDTEQVMSARIRKWGYIGRRIFCAVKQIRKICQPCSKLTIKSPGQISETTLQFLFPNHEQVLLACIWNSSTWDMMIHI